MTHSLFRRSLNGLRWGLLVGSACLPVVLQSCTVSEVGGDAPTKPAMSVRLPSLLANRSAVAIDSITADQDDKTVAISGEITQRSAVLEGWLYEIRDDSGSLWVLSDDSKPEIGETAKVQGVVHYEPIVVGEVDAGDVLPTRAVLSARGCPIARMPHYREHDITLESFRQIDREVGSHCFSDDEYAVVRRVIHTTADFEFKQLITFGQQPFLAAKKALTARKQIVTDVSMVAAGIGGVMAKTWQSPISVAVKRVDVSPPGQTRSALGMQQCAQAYPGAIFVIGNAPTALLVLCEGIARGDYRPALVIGAPVGFINVVESKQALAELAVPYVLVNGRKGGSAIAAAILNALMINAWEQP